MGCLCAKCSDSIYDSALDMEEVREGTSIEIFSGNNEFKLYAVRNNEIRSKISIPKCYIEGKHCTIHTSNDVEIKVEGATLTLPNATEEASSEILAENLEENSNINVDTTDSTSSQKNLVPILKQIETKQKSDLVRDITLLNIVPDLMKKCTISHYVSPSEFYVTLNTNTTCHQFIEDEAHSSISSPLRLAPICEVEMHCLIAEGDCTGRRGVISKIQSGNITVQLLDVGKIIVVEENMLAGIPEKIDFSHIPAMAIKCCLHRCKNIKEVENSLKDLAADKTPAKVHFLGYKKGYWHVSLIRTSDILVKEYEPIFMALGYAAQPKLLSCSAFIGYVDDTNRQIWLQKEEESTLYDQLGELCDVKGNQTEPLSAFNIGDPCLCKAVDDGCWYRAVICSFDNAGHVTVQYIDYGNVEILPCQNVKSLLKDDIMKNHPLSYPCILKDDEKLTDFTKIHQFLNLAVQVDVHRKVGAFFEVTLSYGDMNLVDKLSPEEGFLVQKFIPKFEEETVFVISHIEDDGKMWLQDVRQSPDLDKVMECISTTEQTTVEPSPGVYCCCRYTLDDTWYRAVILSMDDGIHVRYIDYGNTEVTTVDRLKCLDLESSCLQSQSVECCLFDETSNKLMQSPAYADLELVDEYSGWFVQHEEHGLLITRGKSSAGENLCEYVAKATAVEVKTVPPFNIQPNVDIRIVVTDVNENGALWVKSLERETELGEIRAKMATILENESACKLSGEIISGSFCMVMHTVDNMWYRAVVTDVQGDKCEVRFIDYGNCTTVDLTELYEIPDEILILPSQTVQCRFKVLKGKMLTEEAHLSLVALKEAVVSTGKLDEIDGDVLLHSLVHDVKIFDETLSQLTDCLTLHQSPIKETLPQSPVKETLTLSPVKESTWAESPVKATFSDTPVKESTWAESPVKESTWADESPVKATLPDTPVKESTLVESPVKATLPDTPVREPTWVESPVKVSTWVGSPVKESTWAETQPKESTWGEMQSKDVTFVSENLTGYNGVVTGLENPIREFDVGTWNNEDYNPIKVNGDTEDRVDTPTSQNSCKFDSADRSESENPKDSVYHSVANSDSSQESPWIDADDKTEQPVPAAGDWC